MFGSAMALNTAAITRASGPMDKVKVWSGGDSGELFLHEGAPMNGAGAVVEKFNGEYINGIALNKDTNRVFVVTSGKRIVCYDAVTCEKISEVTNAHSKTIYQVALIPEGAEGTILTVSSDNTMKKWQLNEESKELTEMATIHQFEGAEETIDRQLSGLVCFMENDALQTVSVNL